VEISTRNEIDDKQEPVLLFMKE